MEITLNKIFLIIFMQQTCNFSKKNSGFILLDLVHTLGVTQQAVSHRLKSFGMIQKHWNWVPYDLTPRNVEHRFFTCEMLLSRHKRKGFLHRIVTGDEKWIHYDNPKRKKSWGLRGHASTSTAKPNIHGKKTLVLCFVGSAWCRVLWVSQTEHIWKYQRLGWFVDSLKSWSILPT